MDENWYLKSSAETLAALNARLEGLSNKEAKERLLQFGPNKLAELKKTSLWIVFFRQFASPLIIILIIASLIKLSIGGFLDGSVLLFTLFLMAVIGFVQEVKAEKAMNALKALSAHKSKVLREGKVEIHLSEKLVPGDIIHLEIGDKVPADARLIEVKHLKMNESMLNGESLPISKSTEEVEKEATLAERKNMVYSGTVVAFGKGVAVVVTTGMATELGKIATSMQEIKSEETSLQKSIRKIGNGMLLIIFFAIILFVSISFYKGMGLMDIFLVAIAAAVSAIPEGLPIAFTITLAAGMNLMAKRNAIIRKMIAVETLGLTTTICSDKTGTLTLNQMTVTDVFSLKKPFKAAEDSQDPVFKQICAIGMLCSDARIHKEGARTKIVGDPTEGALLAIASNAGFTQEELTALHPRIDEIPFVSENLYMATLHQKGAKQVVYVKGAPEKILSFCTSALTANGVEALREEMHKKISDSISEMTDKALRLIAAAYYEPEIPIYGLKEEDFKGKLIFAGIFGMIDPPRKEAMESISKCKAAGIRVLMITGDNPKTAQAIAKDLGIATKNALSGNELQNRTDEELKKDVMQVSVFARVEPSQKLRIVRALQSLRHVVAMTGDGVNDAPALEAANIGIAMGVTGTDVAKESADMVLSDDRFDSIVAAVEEGRAIFNRLRNICTFLLTTCIGELIGLILSVFFMGLAPLLPLQILWVNLISGSLIAIPLGFEPKIGDEMKCPPRSPDVGLIYRGMLYRIGFLALLLGIGVFSIFHYTYAIYTPEKARTIVLCSLVAFEWMIALKMRSAEIPLRKIGICTNPQLLIAIGTAFVLHMCIIYIPLFEELFHTVALSLNDWLVALIPGAAIVILETLRKEIFPYLFSRGK
jgi:P-type Ca2+ transporter type 2C